MNKAKTVVRVVLATSAYSLAHSVLASRAAKRIAGAYLGERRLSQLYRPFYNAAAVLLLAALCRYTKRLPDSGVYQARGILALLLRAGQAGAAAYLGWTLAHVNVGRLSGWTHLRAWWRGEQVYPDSEGQGPAPGPDGRLGTHGPFRLSRHPLELSMLALAWLSPRAGIKLATFNVLGLLYMVAGAVHTEARMRELYGEEYKAYQRSGVPFFIPHPRRG